MSLTALSSRVAPVVAASLLFCMFAAGVAAQTTTESVFIPNFWDRKRKVERPDTSLIRQLRFLTESDYPPFHAIGEDGQLAGFEIDLARAICAELKAECVIQPRRWDGLTDALLRGQGDAVIASLRITAEARKRVAFTASYYRTPARFLVRSDSPVKDTARTTLAGRRIAVAEGSAHEAYLKAYFAGVTVVPQPDQGAVFSAVRSGSADAGFVDGVTTAVWLNSERAGGCCAFVGGPYTESAFFGEGAGIAVRRDNPRLVQALDWALYRIAVEGTYATLYLKHFPVGFY